MASSNGIKLLFACILLTGFQGCSPVTRSHVHSIQVLPDLPIIAPVGSDLMNGTVLSDYVSEHRITVLYWWSNSCPCVRRYQARIEALMEAYSPDGIGFVAIASNSGESEEETVQVSRERGFKLPIAYDEGGKLAEEIAVTSTPTVVVVERDGNILFQGWVDNERRRGSSGRIAYLEDALKTFLAGTRTQRISPRFGCRITIDLFPENSTCGSQNDAVAEEDIY